MSLFASYVGEVWNTSVSRDAAVRIDTDDPNGNYYRVNDILTFNTSISYTIENDTALDGTRLRFGINNLFDKDPPVVTQTIAGPSVNGNGNTFPGVYDYLGRSIFLGLTAKF